MKHRCLKLAILFCFVFLFHQNSYAQGTFSGEMIIIEPETDAPRSVYSADIDGDGDMDVLTASSNDHKIAWYENTDGTGNFGDQQVITTSAAGAQCVYASDLDGDGDMDVLSASYEDNKIAWYENTDGRGTFSTQQVITTSLDGARYVYAEDLDGDEDMDVLASSYVQSTTNNKIVWYENTDGQGTFGVQRVISDSEYGAWCVHAVDLDGDGDMDVLAASDRRYTTYNRIAWYENTDSQGTFGIQHVISTSADGAQSVYAADLDGDGDMDVLSASDEDDKIAWYENTDGNGAFGDQQVITTLAIGAFSVYAADLDGDGDMDVLSASWVDYKIAWYENTDGLGTFGAKQVITAKADAVLHAAAFDLDGDGDMDVLSVTQRIDRIAWYENTDGLGSFGDHQVINASIMGPVAVTTADLDGDGDKDALSASWEDNMIAWYENTDGLGTFRHQQIISDSLRQARTVYTSDFDGDGDTDVLAASYSDNLIVWYENTDGLGTFGVQQVISDLAAGPYSVYAADLDGDGDMDVLSASWGDWKIAWYENTDGAGNFGDQQVITTSAAGAQCVYASDLDGDGDMDVLSASRDDDTISWYENWDGLGFFAARQIITESADGAWAVYASDLDSDGDMDVLSASYLDGKIAWYENTNGDGSFGSPKNLTSSQAARTVHAADLDNDGDMDVLTPSIVWHENTNGQGTFGNQHEVGSVRSPQSITTSDIDGDGDLDVLCTSELEDKIVWFRNLFVESGVVVKETGIPEVYQLSQNFPNPFNNETVIQFDLKEKGYVNLIVYDLLGKPVATVAEGYYQPGHYTVKFNNDGLPSGIYFYRLQAEGFTEVMKMVLME
jgi:hypothetical protein